MVIWKYFEKSMFYENIKILLLNTAAEFVWIFERTLKKKTPKIIPRTLYLDPHLRI